MRVTRKGRVTILREIRDRLGLLPDAKAASESTGDHGRIRKAEATTRGRLVIEALRGAADVRMSTDEIMALTRGGARPRKQRN